MRCPFVVALCVLSLAVCVRSVQAQACRNGCNSHPDVAGLVCTSGLANESGSAAFFSTSGIPACAAAGTYEVQHATRFDVAGTTEITHLCIATLSSTISGVAIYSSAGSTTQPPAAAPLYSAFGVAVNNVGNIGIVNVAPVNAPLVINGGFWVVTTYNNVTPTTVTQGVATRTGGKAMMRFNQNCNLCTLCGPPCSAALASCQTWVDYDSIGMFQYVGNAPRIRPLRMDNPPPFCPGGGQYTQACCNDVCTLDPSCCAAWDPVCVALAAVTCPSNCNPVAPVGAYVEMEPCPNPPVPPPNVNNNCQFAEVVPCNSPGIFGTISANGGIADEDWYAIDLFDHNQTGLANFQLEVTSESPIVVEVWTGDAGFNCLQNQMNWISALVPSCTTTVVSGDASFHAGANRERFYIVVRSALTDMNACNTGTNDYVVAFNSISNCATQPNDSCAAAVPVMCGTSLMGSTGAASPSNPPMCGGAAGPGVWYSIVGTDENIRLDTCGSSTAHSLSVYIGGCGNLNCIDFSPVDILGLCANPNNASLEFFGFSGVTYLIYVAPQVQHGDFNLNVNCRPANDTCVTAEPVGCGVTVQGNTAHATVHGAPMCNGVAILQGDVWYTMTGTGGQVNVDLCGSLVNHAISVYEGVCGALNCVDATLFDTLNVCAGAASSLGFNSVNGATYYIVIHPHGAMGPFLLNVTCPPPVVANDDCANAMLIAPGSYPWDNCPATTDGPPEPCGFVGLPNLDHDIWFEFVMPCDGNWQVELPAVPFEQLLGVYNLCPLAGGILVGCDGPPIGAPAIVTGPGLAGETFWVRVGGRTGQCGLGALNLTIACNQNCPPDCVESATFLPPPDGIVDGADLAVLLGAWGLCPGCCPDTVTSATFLPPPDGVVDGADLAVLLGAWGNPGCPNGFP